jgi:hypothetical protein
MIRIAMTLTAVAMLVFAPVAMAQEASALDVSEAEAFMGGWTLSFDSPQGPFAMNLDVADVSGKVAATVANDFMGESQVTDISKAGDNLSLKWDADVQGQTMPLTVVLIPDGDGLKASLDFAGMGAMDGTGTR